MTERNTRETVETDYRYAAVDAMLDLLLKGEITVEEVKADYQREFCEEDASNGKKQ